MDFFGTKTHGELEDEEAERLVRPLPKKKPPRRDRRRDDMQAERDPDVEGDSDLKGDPDLSLNYKSIGGSLGLLRRVVARFIAAGDPKMVKVRHRETGKVVNVSEETLKEDSGKYEEIEEESEGADEEKAAGHGAALRELAKGNASLQGLFKELTNPKSDLGGLAEGNPKMPAAAVLRGVTLPEGLSTLGDVVKALKTKPKPTKPSATKPSAAPTKTEAPKAEAPTKTEAPKVEAPKAEVPEAPTKAEAPKVPKTETPKGKGKKPEKIIPPPKRKEPTPQQVTEAMDLLLEKFPPEIAGKYFTMHPDDVKALVGKYSSFKTLPLKTPKDVKAEIDFASHGFTIDPAKVQPPKVAKGADGVEKPFEQLDPKEQSEAMQSHRIDVVSSSLASRARVSEAMQKSGASPHLASAMADFSLSSRQLPPEERDRKAREASRNLFLNTGAGLKEEEEVDERFGTTSPKPKSPKTSKDKLLKSLKDFDPHLQMLAVAHLQGEDYREAHDRFLSPSSPDRISEHDSPKSIYVKLQKASELIRKAGKSYPKEAREALDDPASVFKVRVRRSLRELDPKKEAFVAKSFAHAEAKAYDKALEKYEGEKKDHDKALKDFEQGEHKKWEQARDEFEKGTSVGDPYRQSQKPSEFKVPEPSPPLPPAPPIKPPGYDEIHKPSKKEQARIQEELDEIRASRVASIYSSYRSQKEQMGTLVSSEAAFRRAVRTALYHGVEPYPKGHEGFAPYPDWQQAHQRDLGDADLGVILTAAKGWLTSAVLSKDIEGMVPDARFRAALDLAIREAAEGSYSGAITANLYNQLLAKLASQPTNETLLTIRKEAGFSYAVDTIQVLFYPARKPVPFNIDTINAINHTWVETEGDDGKEHEVNLKVVDTRGGGYLTFQQEKQGLRVETLVWVQVPESDIDKAFKALQDVGKKFGFKVEKSNSSYKPSVRKISNQTEGNAMSLKLAKEEANIVLARLDNLAGAIQEKHASWGMPFEVAKSIVNDLDKTADAIQKAAFGEESFVAHQINTLKAAKVIQQDAGEGYMGTYNAPTAPIQTDADEKYMGLFKDDQTTGVNDGKSTTGRPLAP